MLTEAEELTEKIEENSAKVADDEKRLKTLKELIKEAEQSKFKPGDKTVTLHGKHYDFVTSVSVSNNEKVDTKQMQKDGVYDKYVTVEPTETYRFSVKKIKED